MKIILAFYLLISGLLFADEKINYHYEYRDRTHTTGETVKYLGLVYLASWAVYPTTQLDTVRNHGSFTNYRHNFGQIVFDNDEPVWNWMVHPLSGSQLFLFYRANGYSRIDSLGLAFISSTLFEFTIEIYTEPASIQDLYQTPILGSIFGLGLENLSLYLLNSNSKVARFFGHIINPCSIFGFFEGKVQVVPQIDGKKKGLTLITTF